MSAATTERAPAFELPSWRERLAAAVSQRETVILALLVVEFCAFSVFADGFATSSNLANVLRNATELGLIAAGMTLLIIQGGIDVSVGSILGVVAFAAAKLLDAGTSPVIVLVACLALGAGLGTANGVLVTAARIPPIIATLGTNNVWRAVIFILLGGQILTGIPSFSAGLESGSVAGVPTVFGVVVAVYAGLWYLLRHRVFGRTLYALGNNEEAARLAGLPVRRTQLASYALLGVLVGLAALTYTMRVPSVEVTIGQDYALLAIAAVVIGGASITGGSGTIVGTFMGVLFVSFLRNGLVVLGIPSLWEQAALGAFILLSVGADQIVHRRRARARALAGR
jgi:ribose transport system permease protein/AI-2 transport system permease protein